jgi:hypothetical protein
MPTATSDGGPPARPPGKWWGSRATIAVLALLLALRAGCAIRSRDGIDWDFTNFHNTGARVFHGEWAALYQSGGTIAGRPALDAGRNMVYTGFPITAFELAPIGAFEPRLGLAAFKLQCAVAYAAALWLLWPWFRARWPRRWPAGAALPAWLLIALLFEPFWITFTVGGQTTPLALLGVAVFLRAWRADRLWLAALGYGFAVLNKPFLGVGALVLVAAREWGLLARCAALGGASGLVSLACFGLERHLEWLRIVREESGRWAVPWSKNAAPLSLWNDFWLGAHGWPRDLIPADRGMAIVHVAWKAVMAIGAIAGARAVVHGDASPAEKRTRLALLALLLPLLFSTVVWPHYLALALPLLAAVLAAWPALSRGGRWLVAAAFLGLARACWPLVERLRECSSFERVAAIAAVALFSTLTLFALLLLFAREQRTLLSAREPEGS